MSEGQWRDRDWKPASADGPDDDPLWIWTEPPAGHPCATRQAIVFDEREVDSEYRYEPDDWPSLEGAVLLMLLALLVLFLIAIAVFAAPTWRLR